MHTLSTAGGARPRHTLPSSPDDAGPLARRRLLLHICCAPCATYTVRRLRDEGADVTGHWYNPNIHPYGEHERRREALVGYARDIELPVIWEPGYDMPAFLRAVVGDERYRQRCEVCYRIRLERTAQAAAQGGFELYTTTLLISPYQDVEAIRRIGDELAGCYGVGFYVENLRRGFAESHRLAREAGLYRQKYCGCLYSEWEVLDRQAATNPH